MFTSVCEHNGIKHDSPDAQFIKSQISIKSRKIAVQLNNGWRDIDIENLINLEAPDEDGICRGASSLQVTKYMPHNLMAFHIRVIYEAQLPTKPIPKRANYVIGWQTFLPDINTERKTFD